eukprot:6198753-Pleurochrysis_carterae.AAC.2
MKARCRERTMRLAESRCARNDGCTDRIGSGSVCIVIAMATSDVGGSTVYPIHEVTTGLRWANALFRTVPWVLSPRYRDTPLSSIKSIGRPARRPRQRSSTIMAKVAR